MTKSEVATYYAQKIWDKIAEYYAGKIRTRHLHEHYASYPQKKYYEIILDEAEDKHNVRRGKSKNTDDGGREFLRVINNAPSMEL